MRRRAAAIAAILFATTGLLTAASAAAELGPIQLVSSGAAQPADKALAPALSADGRYVAFEGVLAGFDGVFRKDLASGEIMRVAGIATSEPEPALSRATAPSISADGRYVSFTTRARLDPANDLQAASRDVYVADMATASAGSLPSVELASALDGCDPGLESGCGLSYSNEIFGSEAAGRVALSADGRRVAFSVLSESNLTSGPGGSTEGVPTPPRQVVLRDLATDSTNLVSVARDSGSGAMTGKPVPGGALVPGFGLARLQGAALSADGSTVAWLGAHLPAQVPLASTVEAERLAEVDAGVLPYDEPLWRRVADGPGAPTRRVVAGDGPADPFPDMTQKNTNLNEFQGWLGLSTVTGVPQLSADGRTVALIGNPAEAANLFVVDMAAGLTRAQAVRQLTLAPVIDPSDPVGTINSAEHVARTGHVFDLAISADGRRIAFTTARQQFPLAPPNLIGSPPSSQGLVELYLIDLEIEATQRVTHGLLGVDEPSGNPSTAKNPAGAAVAEEGATAPSLADGLIAFGSTAANLTAGDSNEAGDVFVVEDPQQPQVTASSEIGPGPPGKGPGGRWRLTLSAISMPDGAVKVVAGVPAAGGLRATVSPEPGVDVGTRRLAGARKRAPRVGQVAIELELPKRLRRLARTQEGLHGVARVSFRRAGRKTLHGKVQVRFQVHPKREGKGR